MLNSKKFIKATKEEWGFNTLEIEGYPVLLGMYYFFKVILTKYIMNTVENVLALK